jgi:hypothetical protein
MVMQQINFSARPSLNRSKTFIWLPFAGGISAFAVILPKPMGTGHGVGGGYPDASHVNGCYAETLDRKTGSNFGSLWAIPPYPRWIPFSMTFAYW